MNRCDFSDLPVESCAHCTGRGGIVVPSDDQEIVAVWTARYHGRCDWCDGHITPGERIGKDEQDSYVCERCLP